MTHDAGIRPDLGMRPDPDMRPDPGMNRAAAVRGPYPHDAPEIPEIKEIVA